MVKRARGWIRRLHDDEDGAQLLEVILIIIVGLLILLVLYAIVKWAVDKLSTSKQKVDNQGNDIQLK